MSGLPSSETAHERNLQRAGTPREEYGWEYRLVSGTCSILQFVAATTPCTCRLFQLVAVRRNRSGKTFHPKVVGSIPTRPMREEPVIEPIQAYSSLVISPQWDLESPAVAARPSLLRSVRCSLSVDADLEPLNE